MDGGALRTDARFGRCRTRRVVVVVVRVRPGPAKSAEPGWRSGAQGCAERVPKATARRGMVPGAQFGDRQQGRGYWRARPEYKIYYQMLRYLNVVPHHKQRLIMPSYIRVLKCHRRTFGIAKRRVVRVRPFGAARAFRGARDGGALRMDARQASRSQGRRSVAQGCGLGARG